MQLNFSTLEFLTCMHMKASNTAIACFCLAQHVLQCPLMVIWVQDDYYHCQLMVQVFAMTLAVAFQASLYSQLPVTEHQLMV